jgi:hypothetical protein
MRKAILTAVAAATLMFAGAEGAQAGCYRLGLTGYHWYHYCVGPRFIYPHHRYCGWRHGYRTCWYG